MVKDPIFLDNSLNYMYLSYTFSTIYGIINYEKNKVLFLLHRVVILSYHRSLWTGEREENGKKEEYKRKANRESILALL